MRDKRVTFIIIVVAVVRKSPRIGSDRTSRRSGSVFRRTRRRSRVMIGRSIVQAF